MTQQAVYSRFIGLDVASKKIDIYDSKAKQHACFENTSEDLQRFLRTIVRSKKSILVVMEATGGYQRLLAKGKPKKVAIVAVMRKLLTTLNVMAKQNQKWREPTLALKY